MAKKAGRPKKEKNLMQLNEERFLRQVNRKIYVCLICGKIYKKELPQFCECANNDVVEFKELDDKEFEIYQHTGKVDGIKFVDYEKQKKAELEALRESKKNRINIKPEKIKKSIKKNKPINVEEYSARMVRLDIKNQEELGIIRKQ